MADETDFPPMETMLEDLAKVDGLGWVFQMLEMVANLRPELYTPGERRVIHETAKPDDPAAPHDS